MVFVQTPSIHRQKLTLIGCVCREEDCTEQQAASHTMHIWMSSEYNASHTQYSVALCWQCEINGS